MHRSSLQYELQTCLDALPESQPNVLEGYELPSLRIAVCSESFPRCFVLLRPVHSEDPSRPPESTFCFFRLLFPSPTILFNLRGEPVLFCGWPGTPSKSKQSPSASAANLQIPHLQSTAYPQQSCRMFDVYEFLSQASKGAEGGWRPLETYVFCLATYHT